MSMCDNKLRALRLSESVNVQLNWNNSPVLKIYDRLKKKQNLLFRRSPSSKGLMSGIPWQMTSLTDLQVKTVDSDIVLTSNLIHTNKNEFSSG